MEENLEQLYDDLFIETCADWVVPYIGDLIGYEPLHRVVPKVREPARRGGAHHRAAPAQGHGRGAGATRARRDRLERPRGGVLPAPRHARST